jgi:hypothetical protein
MLCFQQCTSSPLSNLGFYEIEMYKNICLKGRTSNTNIDITLFRSIKVVCGIDNIFWNIPHIQYECGEFSAKYYQSHKTLLWA